MVRPPLALTVATRSFECVRVTDMAGVDLNRYPFDYDLTFCALLMRADGHLYHTFGGRTWRDAQSHLSIPALLRTLTLTLEEHRSKPRARDVERAPRSTVEQLPPLARRISAGKRPDCIHCHNVHDWQMQTAVEAGTWQPKDAWRFPDPIQWGVELDPIEQNRVIVVDRAASKARGRSRGGGRAARVADRSRRSDRAHRADVGRDFRRLRSGDG